MDVLVSDPERMEIHWQDSSSSEDKLHITYNSIHMPYTYSTLNFYSFTQQNTLTESTTQQN
ncbi:uncharacterized protein G2W53_016017 [Senna tora]|uniref:Uncharacterized protein n=1 Tax=Senna tora TaxID=362788 RepID=A0A835C6L1_9FABA|nr:uncharacterized protein G2W53_016017 [Senna tora]